MRSLKDLQAPHTALELLRVTRLLQKTFIRRPIRFVLAVFDHKGNVRGTGVPVFLILHLLGGTGEILLHHLSFHLCRIRCAGSFNRSQIRNGSVVGVGTVGTDFAVVFREDLCIVFVCVGALIHVTEGHVDAVGSILGHVGKVGMEHGILGHDLGLKTHSSGLDCHQRPCGMILKAHVEHVSTGGFDLGQDGGKVFVALVHMVMGNDFNAHFLTGLVHAVGQALGVSGLVINDEDGLGLEGLFHELHGSRRLGIVTAAHAEHVFQTAVGNLFVGGGRG